MKCLRLPARVCLSNIAGSLLTRGSHCLRRNLPARGDSQARVVSDSPSAGSVARGGGGHPAVSDAVQYTTVARLVKTA
jgi:hypothetical protein